MKKWLIAVVPIILIFGIIIIMVFQNGMDVKVMREYGENTEKIKDIPRNYYNQAVNAGKLEEFYYDTFESKIYNEKSRKITKSAIVYTPHDYDENRRKVIYELIYEFHSTQTYIVLSYDQVFIKYALLGLSSKKYSDNTGKIMCFENING